MDLVLEVDVILKSLLTAAFVSISLIVLPASAKAQSSQELNSQLRALLMEGKAEEAMDVARNYVGEHPDDAVARNAFGAILNANGNYVEAIEQANAAVRLAPEVASYRYNRGLIYADHGYFEKAVEDFDAAVVKKPDNAGAYLERGTAYLSLGKASSARADWATARHLAPDDVWVNWHVAMQELVEGNYDLALENMEPVLANHPDYAPGLAWQVLAQRLAGQKPQRAADADSEYYAALLDFHDGKISFDEVLALAGQDHESGDQRQVGEAWLHKAVAERVAGNHAGAIHALQQAIATDAPNHEWKLLARRLLQGHP